LVFGLLAACNRSGETQDNEHRAEHRAEHRVADRAEHRAEHQPAFTLADREARDRARTMARRGAECDKSAGAKLEACRVACRLEHSNSCGWIAADYELGRGVGANLAEALSYYLRACSGGSGLGCHGAARFFGTGKGVTADAQRADRLFAKARFYYRVHCSQGHALSCSRLADLFAAGSGGATDIGVAETYKLRACKMGRAEDCARRQ